MQEEKKPEEFDASIDELRQRFRDNTDEVVSDEKELIIPKEMKGRRPEWVVRSLIAFLVVVGFVEAIFIFQNRESIKNLKYDPLPVENLSEPAEAPLIAPTDIVPPTPQLELPEPTPEATPMVPEPEDIPLPEGVDEIPFPENDS